MWARERSEEVEQKNRRTEKEENICEQLRRSKGEAAGRSEEEINGWCAGGRRVADQCVKGAADC